MSWQWSFGKEQYIIANYYHWTRDILGTCPQIQASETKAEIIINSLNIKL